MAQQKIALECPIDKARQDLPVDPLDPATRIKMTGAGDSIFIPLGGCCCCKRGGETGQRLIGSPHDRSTWGQSSRRGVQIQLSSFS